MQKWLVVVVVVVVVAAAAAAVAAAAVVGAGAAAVAVVVAVLVLVVMVLVLVLVLLLVLTAEYFSCQGDKAGRQKRSKDPVTLWTTLTEVIRLKDNESNYAVFELKAALPDQSNSLRECPAAPASWQQLLIKFTLA